MPDLRDRAPMISFMALAELDRWVLDAGWGEAGALIVWMSGTRPWCCWLRLVRRPVQRGAERRRDFTAVGPQADGGDGVCCDRYLRTWIWAGCLIGYCRLALVCLHLARNKGYRRA